MNCEPAAATQERKCGCQHYLSRRWTRSNVVRPALLSQSDIGSQAAGGKHWPQPPVAHAHNQVPFQQAPERPVTRQQLPHCKQQKQMTVL